VKKAEIDVARAERGASEAARDHGATRNAAIPPATPPPFRVKAARAELRAAQAELTEAEKRLESQ